MKDNYNRCPLLILSIIFLLGCSNASREYGVVQEDDSIFQQSVDRYSMKRNIFHKSGSCVQTMEKLELWSPGIISQGDNTSIRQLWTGRSIPLEGNAYVDSRANYMNHMDPCFIDYYRINNMIKQ